MVSSQKSLKFAVAARRLFGSCGGRSRQAALFTEGVDGLTVSDKDQEACVTYKKAKKQGKVSLEAVGIKCNGVGRP